MNEKQKTGHSMIIIHTKDGVEFQKTPTDLETQNTEVSTPNKKYVKLVVHPPQLKYKTESKSEPITVSYPDSSARPLVFHEPKKNKPCYRNPDPINVIITDEQKYLIQHLNRDLDYTLESLDNQFSGNVVNIAQAILQGFNFNLYAVDFKLPGLTIINGAEGYEPAIAGKDFILKTQYAAGVKYLVQTIATTMFSEDISNPELLNFITESLTETTDIKQWLTLITEIFKD